MSSPQPSRTALGRLRALLLVPLVLVGALALAACSSASAGTGTSSAEPTALRIGFPWNGAPGKSPALTGPLGYAIDKGLAAPIFARYGFDFDAYVPFTNGPPAAQALQSGSVELAVIGDTPAVASRASGLDNRALVVAKPTTDIWLLARVGGPTTLAGLAGKKVALQFGSNFDKYGRAVLQKAGVLDTVQLVNLLFADALPALQRGEVDAVALPAQTAGIWRATTDFPIITKASVDDPDLLATTVTLASSSFLASHPELATAVWEATKAGSDRILADPDAYAQWESDATGVPLEVVKQANLFHYGTAAIDPDGLATVEQTAQFLVEQGTAKAAPDIATWVVNQ